MARWTQKPGPPCHDSSSAVGSAGRSDGTAFMTFDEAAMVVPAFARRGGNGGPALLASRKAWDRLVLDLSLLDVAPVPGEGVHDAQQVWRGEARPSPGAPDGDALSDNGRKEWDNEGRGHHWTLETPNLKRDTKRHNPKVGI